MANRSRTNAASARPGGRVGAEAWILPYAVGTWRPGIAMRNLVRLHFCARTPERRWIESIGYNAG